MVTGLLPFLITANVLYYKFSTGFSSDSDKLYAGANQTVSDAFSSVRVVQAYCLNGRVVGLYDRMLETVRCKKYCACVLLSLASSVWRVFVVVLEAAR